MTKISIKPKEVLFIKLGRGGKWEEECLRDGVLPLSFREVPHELCLKCQKDSNWDAVQKAWHQLGKLPGVATRHTNQTRHFYESGEDVLWVTFSKDSLWWCFAGSNIVQLEDKQTKIRKTIAGWSNKDIDGVALSMNLLSGGLLAMRGFRGTICRVKQSHYLIDKINGVEPSDIALAVHSLAQLECNLIPVIQRLEPKDLEILIDLIFRQMGCQRVSELGKTMKDLDLVLRSPMDDELYGVQVKTASTLKEFKRFRDEQAKGMNELKQFYFVVHTPDSGLSKYEIADEEGSIKLLLPTDIARLTVRHGLTQWVIDKAR